MLTEEAPAPLTHRHAFVHVFDKHTGSSVSAQFTCLIHWHDCFMYNTASIYAACILIKNNKRQSK